MTDKSTKCPVCKGSGYVRYYHGIYNASNPIPAVRGEEFAKRCRTCHPQRRTCNPHTEKELDALIEMAKKA